MSGLGLGVEGGPTTTIDGGDGGEPILLRP
jgi:hypothetical protein